LRALWEAHEGQREAARRAGVPASTARTWFSRFEAGLCSCEAPGR